MNFFWRNSHVSRAQVLADIDSVLTAIRMCVASNKDSLTQEDVSSFMNEYASLPVVRSNKGATHDTLLQALDDCKELKLKIERACSRPQDIMIRGPESPTATTSEADTDSTLAPSTKLVDPNPTATSFDPSAQVLADIDSVLGAILKYCADNMDSFTQEERLSFMNEHCSLSGVQFNEGATLNTLLQALGNCKKLKLRIETAYSRHLIIRGTVSPAATTGMGGCYLLSPSLKTGCHESTDTDLTLAPSTKVVDPNPTITTVDPRAQVLTDIDSVTEAILEYFTDNWDSLTQEQRLSFEDECFSLSDVRLNEGMTHSALTKVLDDRKGLKLRIETACTKHQVDDIKRTLVCRAETTTGIGRKSADTDSTLAPSTKLVDSDLTITSFDPSPPYKASERPISVQSNLTSTNGSHLGPSYPSTGTHSVTSIPCSDYEVGKTSSITSATFKRGSTRASATEKDCMIFSEDSVVTGATFNIDSEGSCGATISEGSHSRSRKKLPRAGARQLQQPPVSRNGVMYFAPSTEVNYATMNIRSPRASAAMEQGSQRSEPLSDSESFQSES
ncbi:hypothetical protein P692DRAFT_20836446 [Suillus brevipes Sb2]|nr:hypothetical protein P692DRAFT_20836446 [Suillus brevipes Sb2]